MPRAVCPHCGYPEKTCLCASIKSISTRTQIDILQHPSEVTVAKNTARLCALCLPNCRIWVGESEADFLDLRNELEQETRPTLLLYPDDTARNIGEFSSEVTSEVRLLVLDGTWKKTYKLKQLNRWLDTFPKVQLRGVTGNYEIRKAPKPGQLSTLEAIYHSLRAIEPSTNAAPLLSVFEARKDGLRRP